MGFIEQQAEEWVLTDLLDTLSTLEEDINLQKRQINELVIDDRMKEEYITDDVNVVKSILPKLDFNELSALQSIFYYMEQHFYMMNRTEEEQQAFIKGIADEYNDIPTANYDEEDDWTDLSDVDIN